MSDLTRAGRLIMAFTNPAYVAPPPEIAFFEYTGSNQNFVVPAGVFLINIDLVGSMGGGTDHSLIGFGGRLRTQLTVTPLETLTVKVGGRFLTPISGGFGGGGHGVSDGSENDFGGGGATSILRDSTLLAISGGGGGYGSYGFRAGSGGDEIGDAAPAIAGGYGGEQTIGGRGGVGWEVGGSGSSLLGGIGSPSGGGGGGGGFYGGGGGSGEPFFSGAGGGGSSSAPGSTRTVLHAINYNSFFSIPDSPGTGWAYISWGSSPPASEIVYGNSGWQNISGTSTLVGGASQLAILSDKSDSSYINNADVYANQLVLGHMQPLAFAPGQPISKFIVTVRMCLSGPPVNPAKVLVSIPGVTLIGGNASPAGSGMQFTSGGATITTYTTNAFFKMGGGNITPEEFNSLEIRPETGGDGYQIYDRYFEASVLVLYAE